MDALILSCGTGGGHDAAAKAIECVLQQHGVHTVTMNPYCLCSEKTAQTINHAYVGTVKHCPTAFGFVYRIGNWYRKLPWRSPVYHCNRKMAQKMQSYLEQHSFDIIIATHLFPAEIITQMKNQGMSVPKTIFVATDYACIPFTEETCCDAYVIPSEALSDDFIRRGIPAEKIHSLGIPVHPDFTQNLSRKEAREELHLFQDRRYILICGGSMGAGGIMPVIKEFLMHRSTDTELIVICGSNEKLYRKLQKKYGTRLYLIQHTDKMPLYLKACNVYLSKPGGLSSTEAASMGVPLIHLPPIPGCETINADYFSRNGMSIKYTKSSSIKDIYRILNNPVAQCRMAERQKALLHGNAAEDIYMLACDLACQRKPL